MKKILILVVVVVIGFLAYQYHIGGGDKLTIAPTVSRPDPSNATFLFEDGPITLKDGVSSEKISPESVVETTTTLSDIRDFGDINNDGKNDTVAVLVKESGVSGLFIYIAAYTSGNVEYKGSNAIFVGDSVSPESININSDGTITLKYLDRKPGEAIAEAPTVETTRTYAYKNGKLEQR